MLSFSPAVSINPEEISEYLAFERELQLKQAKLRCNIFVLPQPLCSSTTKRLMGLIQ